MSEHPLTWPCIDSLRAMVGPVRGASVLLWGLSGRGFPGGDGAHEAVELLPLAGIDCTYTHAADPDCGDKLSRRYDVAIVANTRIGALLESDARLWTCAPKTALWFWDLRSGSVAAPLAGRVSHVFLSYNGPWVSPDLTPYEPAQWAASTGGVVGYCPQGSPLRASIRGAVGHPRIVFVGDLANRTYHDGRAAICRALDVTVRNARDRAGRLRIEADLPTIYGSARYSLSMSPRAPAYTSVRTYSILAHGGLMLLHRFPGCESLFTDGENAVLFDDVPELAEKLARLDDDPTERERIADAGRLLHATRHTVAHRVVDICRQIATC